MSWMRTASFAWEGMVPEVGIGGRLKSAARLAAVAGFLAFFIYCATIGWSVLGELGRVKLADCRRVVDVVSVRDVILCFLGYRLGFELLRSAMRNTRR